VGIVYARSTTIQAQASSIDAGIAHVRDEVMPALTGVDGCVGLSLLVDRQSGRCIATSAWQSAEAMRASDASVRPIRDRAADIFGGSPQVDEWEIAVLHRNRPSGDGACVRATWTQGQSAELDRGIDAFRIGVLPEVERFDGFCSASLMVARNSGRAVASITFDSRDAMQGTRERANTMRSTWAEQAGASVVDVGEFELAVAHLRVPEMV
jgi:hypothetical protein